MLKLPMMLFNVLLEVVGHLQNERVMLYSYTTLAVITFYFFSCCTQATSWWSQTCAKHCPDGADY